MSVAAFRHRKVLMRRARSIWKETVVAAASIVIHDFKHQGLASGAAVVHARTKENLVVFLARA